MAVSVPAQYQSLVTSAAAALGIPAGVVAAQINDESGFNPNAVSPAGAQGIAQFMPGTWATQGSGSPFNAVNAFAAYVKYMGTLLKQEHGSVRDALAAYNAGPGNLSAGYGYADKILAEAGQGVTLSSGATGSTPVTSGTGSTGGITDPTQAIVQGLGGAFGSVLAPFVKMMIWGTETMIGLALMVGGVFVMVQGSKGVQAEEKKVGTEAVATTAKVAAPEADPEIAEAEAALKSSRQVRRTSSATSARVRAENKPTPGTPRQQKQFATDENLPPNKANRYVSTRKPLPKKRKIS
jgi:Transglycosylase SLT domain